jgi:uroporphyrinogen decarboxylase
MEHWYTAFVPIGGASVGFSVMPPTADLADAPLLRACRGLPAARVPVWFMRQAGRSLPEYRALRGTGSILDAIKDPDLATEITLQPVRRYGVDAAILYSDIVVPAEAIGFGVDVEPGVGPVIAEPFRTKADLDRLRAYEPEADAPYVQATVRQVVAELGSTPLIGFAGAPFTVASYLVEGRPSRTYGLTKAMLHGDPELFAALLDRLADIAIASLRAQIDAGASAVQLFDSWAGALSPDVYEQHVMPASAKVFAAIADTGVPRIHFGVGTGELLTLMGDAGADVVGVDWRVPLDVARQRVPGKAVQGNLDPAVCLSPWEVVADRTRDVLRRNGGRPGHVFNLGHGVLPELDPGILAEVVNLVHAEGRTDGEAAAG